MVTSRNKRRKKRPAGPRTPVPQPVQLDNFGRAFCPGCFKDVPFDRNRMQFWPHEFTASGEPCKPNLDKHSFRTPDGHIISATRARKIRAGKKGVHREVEASIRKSERYFKATGEKATFLGGAMTSNRKKF